MTAPKVECQTLEGRFLQGRCLLGYVRYKHIARWWIRHPWSSQQLWRMPLINLTDNKVALHQRRSQALQASQLIMD